MCCIKGKYLFFTSLSALSQLTPGKWLCNGLCVFQCELSLRAQFTIHVLIKCSMVFKRLINGKAHKNFFFISGAQKINISVRILLSLTNRHFIKFPVMHSVVHCLIFPRLQLKDLELVPYISQIFILLEKYYFAPILM